MTLDFFNQHKVSNKY